MITKAKVKFVKSLHIKKYRLLNHVFVAETPKVVEMIINSPLLINEVFCTKEFYKNNPSYFDNKKFPVYVITDAELKNISNLNTPNSVLAIVKIPASEATPCATYNILLDGIADPGNLGTIIRTADWFGITHIFCSENCVDAYNPKVVQSSMGSIANVNIFYTNLENFIKQYKNFPVYGFVLNGKSFYETKFEKKGLILLGNETLGIDKSLMKLIDFPVTIPLRGNAESLNVAITCGIACAEITK